MWAIEVLFDFHLGSFVYRHHTPLMRQKISGAQAGLVVEISNKTIPIAKRLSVMEYRHLIRKCQI